MENKVKYALSDSFSRWAEVYFAPFSGNCDRYIPRAIALEAFIKDSNEIRCTMQRFMMDLKLYCRNTEYIKELNPEELKNSQGHIIKQYLDFNGKTTEMIYVRTKKGDRSAILDEAICLLDILYYNYRSGEERESARMRLREILNLIN